MKLSQQHTSALLNDCACILPEILRFLPLVDLIKFRRLLCKGLESGLTTDIAGSIYAFLYTHRLLENSLQLYADLYPEIPGVVRKWILAIPSQWQSDSKLTVPVPAQAAQTAQAFVIILPELVAKWPEVKILSVEGYLQKAFYNHLFGYVRAINAFSFLHEIKNPKGSAILALSSVFTGENCQLIATLVGKKVRRVVSHRPAEKAEIYTPKPMR
jgi:hypothetical protein